MSIVENQEVSVFQLARPIRRLAAVVAVAAAVILGSAAPAAAGGYCVTVNTQSGYGAQVCIPWGG